MFKDAYRGRKVFVTGHTGFKGSWLSLWLTMLDAEVIGYSLAPPSNPNLFETIGIEDAVVHIDGDIRHADSLRAALAEHQPEIVFHLAAQPLVRRSYAEPRLTYETNVMGTVNVLDAVRHTPSVRAVVNVTSDKCYENKEWVWGYRENDPMGGHSPYSSSKGCADLVASAYGRSFFSPEDYGTKHNVALATVRAGNVIGGGDWGADRLIPDCVRALNENEGIPLRRPNAVRPWQHVLEPLGGYLLLGAGLLQGGSAFGGPWNFGPVDGEIWTVQRVVQEVCKLWGGGNCFRVTEDKLHEAHWLKLDCSKALSKLNWKPKYGVEAALRRTVEWYRKFYSGMDGTEMRRLTSTQIEEYAELQHNCEA